MLKKLLQTFTQPESLKSLRELRPTVLDEGLFGVPRLQIERCTSCGKCADTCPTSALTVRNVQEDYQAKRVSLQLTNCIFCGRCHRECAGGVITEERWVEVAVSQKANAEQVGLFSVTSDESAKTVFDDSSLEPMIERVNLAIFGAFSRSLQLYVASAGSCGGCEDELSATLGPFYQGSSLGVSLTKNPLHADAFFVTGAIPRQLIDELQSVYHAAPSPKIVIAAGACACDGNVFRGSYALLGAADRALPVDVYIPGCPPTPKNLLHGLSLAMERAQEKVTRTEYVAPSLPQVLSQTFRKKPVTRPMPSKHKEPEPTPVPLAPKAEPAPASAAATSPAEANDAAMPSESQLGQPRASKPIDPVDQ